jgi:hypothetical protein
VKSFQFKRTQRKYKTGHRISNWATYEAGLRQRGSVTLWLSEDARDSWCHTGRRKPGGKRLYSNAAIETFFTIRLIYGLALRQTEGFIESLFELAGVILPVPDHSPARRTRVIIPPQRGALLSPETATAMQDRNRHIRLIHRIGRRQWHHRSGFTRRSKVESIVYRYKEILGREMKARTLAGQRVEARIGCRILNTMARLGMPKSYRAA